METQHGLKDVLSKRKMRVYTLEETKDCILGKEGTPIRDRYESELQSFFIDKTINKLD